MDAAEDHFIATVSHELKTPIASILMKAPLCCVMCASVR
ncbi:MAG: hypothetical protein IPH53_12675 [Flavobacteriales bacterium]|nr:hypothetical protein [Flavobacteriales bacterium]